MPARWEEVGYEANAMAVATCTSSTALIMHHAGRKECYEALSMHNIRNSNLILAKSLLLIPSCNCSILA